MTNETLLAIPETGPATRNRRPRGLHPKKADQPSEPIEKKLPECLEAHEVNAPLRAAPHARAKLLMMIEWRARLRVSEGPGA